MTSNLPRLLKSASQLESNWQKKNYDFCFIGGIAVQRWGEPRNTNDLDLTLLTGFGQEKPYIDALLSEYQPRQEGAGQFALLNRVLLIQDATGIPIDVSLGGMPFEERCIQRASQWELPESESITTCSASDLITLKAFAARPQDWSDIRGIAIRSKELIDWDQIFEELTPLVKLKEEPEILEQLKSIKKKRATGN